jgi:hypothetical protein
MMTSVEATGGVLPGVVCYLYRSNYIPEPGFTNLQTDDSPATACGVVQNGSNFQGRALVPASYVNKGYNIRIMLFWIPDPGWGPWDY